MIYLTTLRAHRGPDHWGNDSIAYIGHEKNFHGATRGRFRIYADNIDKSLQRYGLLGGSWEMWREDGQLYMGQLSDQGKATLRLRDQTC